MAPQDENDPAARVDVVANSIAERLQSSVGADGKLSLDAVKGNDAELYEVLHQFALSKTWRDDPTTSARDVAKLLEAQSKSTPLGAALETLSQSLKK
ncbi:UNVERIFIED_ORG: hypothetical protein J2W66_002665 [Agrobacterium larrymoorei]|nr:hypothetical protein [Agrobacterium larrymoorei]